MIDFDQPLPSHEKLRDARIRINPDGFFIRHPPKPHELDSFITPDSKLFQTIHMGAAEVDTEKWLLLIDGLVKNPISINLKQLLAMPRTTITAFHECYGSPLKPPTEAVWRIGNVEWTGVRLVDLLKLAEPFPAAQFVWSEGLDKGSFAGVTSDRYQKDLPMSKATCPEVLVAFEMNGKPLSKERGGPVRLVVPGWFGTNMTKWLCRLSLQAERAPGPFTTTFYNEIDPADEEGKRKRPVWATEINSMIVRPAPDAVIAAGEVLVEGWAWCNEPVERVLVRTDQCTPWCEAIVSTRTNFGWQEWSTKVTLCTGERTLIARALSATGAEQPFSNRRNHVHVVRVKVI